MERTNTCKLNDLIVTDTQIRTTEEKINKTKIQNDDRSFVHKSTMIVQSNDYDINRLEEEGYIYERII